MRLCVGHLVGFEVLIRREEVLVHVASAEEEDVVVLGHHAIDDPAKLELRALGLRLRGCLDVRHAKQPGCFNTAKSATSAGPYGRPDRSPPLGPEWMIGASRLHSAARGLHRQPREAKALSYGTTKTALSARQAAAAAACTACTSRRSRYPRRASAARGRGAAA